MARKAQRPYRVLKGLNYRPHGDTSKPEVRAEPRAIVDDLPPESVPWLLEQRAIMEHQPAEAEEDG